MGFLKQKIKEKAFEIGFSHIGFSRAEKLPAAPLLNWLVLLIVILVTALGTKESLD